MPTKAASGGEPPSSKEILLTVDDHDAHCMIRRKNLANGQESVRKVATERDTLRQWMLTTARDAKAQRGRAVWIQESTTGWARMNQLAGDCRNEFVVAKVLQTPLPPKAKRRKTDTIDTARLQREYLNGQLPRAHQPPPEWRQLCRVVALRVDLVRRRTALSNWINPYLAHETWLDPRCRSVRALPQRPSATRLQPRAVAVRPRHRLPGARLENRGTPAARATDRRGRGPALIIGRCGPPNMTRHRRLTRRVLQAS